MDSSTEFMESELEGSCLVATPRCNMGESECEMMHEELDQIVQFVRETRPTALIVDLSRTEFIGSTAIGYFLKLRRTLLDGVPDGRLGVCGASRVERETFSLLRMETLWSMYDSREEALEAVKREVVAAT